MNCPETLTGKQWLADSRAIANGVRFFGNNSADEDSQHQPSHTHEYQIEEAGHGI
jgi:hypothetical protein